MSTHREWTLNLDDAPLHVRVEVRGQPRRFHLWVDGFLMRQQELPSTLEPHVRVDFDLSEHACAVFLVPHQGRIRVELAIDHVCVDSGRPQAHMGHPAGDTGMVEAAGPRVEAGVPFDASWWYRHHLRWPAISAATTVCSAAMVLGAGSVASRAGGDAASMSGLVLMGLVGLGSGVFWLWQDRAHMRSIFRWGDLRPARVVQLNPVHLVTAVDLALPGYRPSWHLKRTVHPPECFPEGLAIGDVVPVVLFRLPTQDGKTHPDVAVYAVAEGCADLQQQRRVAGELRERDLMALEAHLNHSILPERPGSVAVLNGEASS